MTKRICLELNQSIKNHFNFLERRTERDKVFCVFNIDTEDNLTYGGYQGATFGHDDYGEPIACGATYFFSEGVTTFLASGTEIYVYKREAPRGTWDTYHLKFRIKNPNVKVFKTPEEFWRDKNDKI